LVPTPGIEPGTYRLQGDSEIARQTIDPMALRTSALRNSSAIQSGKMLGAEWSCAAVFCTTMQRLPTELDRGKAGPLVDDADIAAICLQHGVRELWSV